ncbi:MAG: PqqD family protein [Acidobacteriota bacterium]
MVGGPASIVVKNPNVHWTVLEGEAVLVNLENGFYYNLNKVGTAIWELLDAERPLSEVLSSLCSRFDVPDSKARADLEQIIETLTREQLVEHVAEQAKDPKASKTPIQASLEGGG